MSNDPDTQFTNRDDAYMSSRHLSRSHLKSMFAKVGVRSQSNLLRRILAGPASFLTDHSRRQNR